MGCDIHGVVQTRWRHDDRFRTDLTAGFDRDRNYVVFAILAGVRNYYDQIPISEPRGLPADLGQREYPMSDNDPDPREYTPDDFGDHSYSWLTLTELLAYDWTQPLYIAGYVGRKEYEAAKAEGRTPNSWCGNVGGGGTVKTTEAALAAGTAPEDWNYVYATWTSSSEPWVKQFKAWIDWLAARYAHEGADNVRLVFGFDS